MNKFTLHDLQMRQFGRQVLRGFVRRWFLWSLILLLCTPLAVQFFAQERSLVAGENRVLASRPDWPMSWTEMSRFGNRYDDFLKDHFGLRATLVAGNAQLHYRLFSEAPSTQMSVGKAGYLFFNSHSAGAPFRMIDFLCGSDVKPEVIAELANRLNDILQMTQRGATPSLIAFAPSKPVLYGEFMPDWLQTRCQQSQPSLPLILKALHTQSERAFFVYPLAQMQNAKAQQQLYPKENFHWHGRGAQVFADTIAQQYWHLSAQQELHFKSESAVSDMQNFMPGIPLQIEVEMPDLAQAKIQECRGGLCLPGLAHAALLGDISHFVQSAPDPKAAPKPRKLLIISDSFGQGAAAYFAPYFSEVWHVSSNNMGILNEAQLSQVRASFEAYHPDQLLYLFHDFSVTCFSNSLNYCPLNLTQLLPKIHPYPNISLAKNSTQNK